MIEYDYLLTRDLFAEKETQRPHEELKGPLNNIIVVEGPNGKGKSLLMNIIAMSSFGYENREVPASLKDDMAEYLRGDSTKLSFKIKIEDPVSKTILKAEHNQDDGANVQVSESTDGGESFRVLSASEFNERYNLIYDIPENPRKRIMGIISNAKYVQDDCKKKLGEAQNLVGDMLDDISDHSIDGSLLEEYKAQVASFDKTSAKEIGQLEKLKNQYETLIRYYHAKKLLQLKKNRESAESDLKEVTRQEHLKETRPKQIASAYSQKISGIRSELFIISNKISEIEQDILKIKDPEVTALYRILKTWDIEKIIAEKKVEANLYSSIGKMIKCLDKHNEQPETEIIRLLETLLNELEQFKGKNLSLKEGSVDQIFSSLESQYKEKKTSKKGIVDVSQLKVKLETLKNLVYKISLKLSDLEDPPKISSEKQYCDQDKIDRYALKVKKAKEAETEGYNDAHKFGVDFTNASSMIVLADKSLVSRYDRLDIQSIYNDALDIKASYDTNKKEYDQEKKEIDRKKAKIEEWEQNVESVYACHEAAINKISDQLFKINKKLEEMGKRFRAVENGSYQGFNEDDSLFPILWKYLGRRLKTVRYNDKEYTVVAVNAMKQQVVTETVLIPMSSFSTGLNQRNYLLTKLSTEDSRPIIALFDEIGIMDPGIQSDLVDRMVKLQTEGKLLVGMLNRPAPKMNVINYGQ